MPQRPGLVFVVSGLTRDILLVERDVDEVGDGVVRHEGDVIQPPGAGHHLGLDRAALRAHHELQGALARRARVHRERGRFPNLEDQTPNPDDF